MRNAGLALLVAALLGWLAFVPGVRERARQMSAQSRQREAERAELAERVARLEARRLVGERLSAAAGVDGADLRLRAAVVALLEGRPLRRTQVSVTQADPPAAADLRLQATGETQVVLDLLRRLSHPMGPLALERVDLRPNGERDVTVSLEGRSLRAMP